MSYTYFSIFLLFASFLAFLSYRFEIVSSRFIFLKGLILYVLVMIYSFSFGDMSLVDSVRLFEESLDFHNLIIHGLLSYLLFAGALHINVSTFMGRCREIIVLALLSTTLATFATAVLLTVICHYLGLSFSWLACLLFAACISPTDPIAVLSLLKSVNLPRALSTTIAGESLLNDGVGIVFFTTFLHMLHVDASYSGMDLFLFFCQEAVGGILLGYLLAYMSSLLLSQHRLTDYDYGKQDIYWSLSLVNICYLTALSIDVSPALACVSAGLSSANFLQKLPPSRFKALLSFWDIVDDLLNTALFFLSGTFIFTLDFSHPALLLSIIAVAVVTFSRLLSVILPLSLLFPHLRKSRTPALIALSGLKGGLSLALALSIPNTFAASNDIVFITFVVVAFTLLVQSAAVEYLAKKRVA